MLLPEPSVPVFGTRAEREGRSVVVLHKLLANDDLGQ